MDWGVVALSLVPAVLTFLGSMLMFRPQRNKMRADAAGVLVGASVDMVQRLEEQVTALECKVDTQDGVIAGQAKVITEQGQEIANLKTRLDEMEAERDRFEQENGVLLEGVARLTDQIVGHGYNPAWRPDVGAPTPPKDEGNRGLGQPLGRH